MDIDAPTLRGSTPLVVAAAHGMVDVLRALVAKGANVHAKTEAGLTALHAAAHKGQMATVRWLIAHGADPRKGARWLDGVPRRASTLADHYGYSEVGAYLRTCEERAEAA